MQLKFAFIFFLGLGVMGVGSLHAQLYQQWSYKFGKDPGYLMDTNNLLYTGNVVVDENGNSYLFAQDDFVFCIFKFNTQGLLVWRLDSLPFTEFPPYTNNLNYWNGNLYYACDTEIIKINPSGNVVWVWVNDSLLGNYADGPEFQMDNLGNLIIAWQSSEYNQSLVKIGQNGNVIWRYSYNFPSSGDSTLDYNNSYVSCDSVNNIILTFNSNVWTVSGSVNEQRLFKFSETGDLLWSFSQISSNDETYILPVVRRDGSVLAFMYNGASNNTTVDVFSNAGVMESSSQHLSYYTPICAQGNYYYYMEGNNFVKTDSNLNTLFSYDFSTFSYQNSVFNNRYIYLVGLKNQDSLGQEEIYQFDYNMQLIQTLLPVYTNYIGQYKPSTGGLDSLGNLYLLSTDWDDSAELYKFCSNCRPDIFGRLYYDSNQNCQMDNGEYGIESRIIELSPGPYYAVSDINGNFGFIAPPGNYNLIQSLPSYWNASCSDTFPILLDSSNATSFGNLLGSYPIPGITDLQITMDAGEGVPGNYQYISTVYSNGGTTTDSGFVQVNIDSLFLFSQSWPMPDSISGNSLFWNYSNLQPGQSAEIDILNSVPAYIPPYYIYQLSCFINPVIGDTNPANNYDTIFGWVLSSFDPNSKSCSVKNTTAAGNLTDSSVLTYTISFQNTGTDTARTIVVVDTLDPSLDIATFTMIQSSIKNYQLSFVGPGILEWIFDNASLPDSSANLAMSQAFIKYSIAPKQNLLPGTTIFNSATIYFDFNPGVTTNTTVNYFENVPSGINEVSGFDEAITVYPNPMSDLAKIVLSNPPGLPTVVSVYDVSGRLIATQNFGDDKNMLIERNTMASGLYMVEVKQHNQRIGVAKVVIQ